ncbi:MAG: hypothetical protein AABX35_04605, partial [Nanoarchaeota archaeon]
MRISPSPYVSESYSVSVVNLAGGRLYCLDILFNCREDALNRANNEGQLSPGEQKGLARFLDDGDNPIRYLAE